MGEDYCIATSIHQYGPIKDRKCTDILCLIIFLLFTGFAGYIGYYAYENGDPDLIFAPMDAQGNFCGITPGYEEYPFVYYTDISSFWPPYAVCVTECPDEYD